MTSQRRSKLAPEEVAVTKRLATALERSGLTQRDVAKKLGTYHSRVSKWVNGHEMPSARFLIALPELLGVSAGWLLTGEGPMRAELKHFDGDAAEQALAVVKSAQTAVKEAAEALDVLRGRPDAKGA